MSSAGPVPNGGSEAESARSAQVAKQRVEADRLQAQRRASAAAARARKEAEATAQRSPKHRAQKAKGTRVHEGEELCKEKEVLQLLVSTYRSHTLTPGGCFVEWSECLNFLLVILIIYVVRVAGNESKADGSPYD